MFPSRVTTAALLLLATAFPALGAEEKVVIAHRGASGYLPEHTLAAYALGHALGADWIEPDLVMTRDGVLIALHDIHLEATTDVEQVYPDRARDDGRWYAADFDLDEIERLRAHERVGRRGEAAFPQRYPITTGDFRVPTFEQVLRLVQELNRLSGCRVGVYPETKDPEFHDREGLPMEEELLRVLGRFGWRERDDPVIVQSFDPRNLEELRRVHGTRLRLVQLISDDRSHDRLISDEGLERIASYADGIGPEKGRLSGDDGRRVVASAHRHGLVVHPYTFRADRVGAGFDSFEAELVQYLFEIGVDGVFTDHPDRAARVVAERGGGAATTDCRWRPAGG